MRLQLRAALWALPILLALPAPARAQTQFISKVQVYVDNDRTEVVSPLVHAQSDLTPTWNVSAGYVADIVTSASVDIVSQASKSTIHDVRHQGSFGLTKTLEDWTLHAGYIYSTENDYASHNVAAGAERRLFENDTTLALGGALSLNNVGRAGDLSFHRKLGVGELSATVTQVLTSRLVGQLGYTFGLAQGYQASPYRFVPIRDSMGELLAWVAETDPDQRLRHAAVGGINYLFARDAALQADYRFYYDTWSIMSHTVSVRLLFQLSRAIELRLRNRFYVQNAASFYASTYTDFEQYMTFDRELSPFWSDLVGGKLSWKITPAVELEGKVDVFYFAYSDFPLLPSRTGANVESGVALTY
jgi:Protein of unknown function (DUF3570)